MNEALSNRLTVSNNSIINEIKIMCLENLVTVFATLYLYLPGEAEENHKDPHNVSRHSQESSMESSSIKVTRFKADFDRRFLNMWKETAVNFLAALTPAPGGKDENENPVSNIALWVLQVLKRPNRDIQLRPLSTGINSLYFAEPST